MKLVALIAVLLPILLLVAACEPHANPTAPLTPLPTSDTFAPVTVTPITGDPSVPWENYPAGTGIRLAGLAELHDCAALKAEFTVAYDGHAAQRRRTGIGNEAILVYIDTLNVEAFQVYPHEFTLERTKGRPLLYMYRMRFSVLKDLLQSALFSATGDFLSAGTLGGDFIAKLGSLGNSIFNTVAA